MRRVAQFLSAAGMAFTAILAGSNSSLADSYPERPITLIVPWGAGGGADALARVFASQLEIELKTPVNVVNRTGGSGVVGHLDIANATADGYTLGIATIEIATFKPLGLSELTPADLTPIAHLAISPAGLTVRADSPFQGAQQAIEAIRKAPKGEYLASGTGQGGSWHIALAGMLGAVGLEPDHVRWVPSQGGAPALQDLMAGGVTFFTGSPAEALSLAEAGRVRTLAVMHPGRVEAFPDIPTLKETNGTEWAMGSPYGLVAPKGLPAEIQEQVSSAARTAFESSAFQEFLKERGYAPQWMDGAEFQAFLDERSATLGKLISELGLGQ